MEYVWAGFVSLVVALLGNRFFAGSGYSLVGDAVLGLVGGLGGAYLFGMTTVSAGVGLAGLLIFAAIGAGLFLLLRRSFDLG